MNWQKFFAGALLLGAIFLAVIGYLAWSSGEPYMRLVGLIAAGGAVALFIFALEFFSKKPASGGGGSGGLFRQLVLLGIALYALGVPLYAVVATGKMPALALDNKRMISRSADPQSFWLMAGLHAVPGVYCLFLVLRRSGRG